MTKANRIGRLQQRLTATESFLLWMESLKAKGGFSEYWKFATFVSWPYERGEEGLLYHLFFEVNTGVQLAIDRSKLIGKWASLVGLAMLGAKGIPVLPELAGVGDLEETWRQGLCAYLEEVLALEHAVEIISDVYFDGHEVLFSDVKEELAAFRKRATLLISGYNLFAAENNLVLIDAHAIEESEASGVNKHIDQWCAFAPSDHLLDRGHRFEARDVLIGWLKDGTFVIGPLKGATRTSQT